MMYYRIIFSTLAVFLFSSTAHSVCEHETAASASGLFCEISGPSEVEVGERFEVHWSSLGGARMDSFGWEGPTSPPIGALEVGLEGKWGGDLHLSEPGTASVTMRVSTDEYESFCHYEVTAADHTPPTLLVVSPTQGAVVQTNNTTFVIIALDDYNLKPGGVTYKVNGGTEKVYDMNVCYLGVLCIDNITLQPGMNVVEFFAEDLGGNVATQSVQVVANTESGPLACYVNGPDEVVAGVPFDIGWGTTGGSVTSMTAHWIDDDNHDQIRYVRPSDGEILWLGPDQGLPNYDFWGDIVKLAGDKPSSVIITASGPAGTTYCGHRIKFSDGFDCKIDGPSRVDIGERFSVAWSTTGATEMHSLGWTGPTFIPIGPLQVALNGEWGVDFHLNGDGLASVTMEATNAANKKTRCDYSVFAANLSDPTLNVFFPANNATVNSYQLPIGFLASDPGGLHGVNPIRVKVNDGPWENKTMVCFWGCWVTAELEPGVNTVTIRAKDFAGRTTDVVRTVTFTPQPTCSYPACDARPNLEMYPVQPCRLYDSRTDGVPLQMNQPQSIRVAGEKCGIPHNAKVVMANLTVVSPTAEGRLIAYPSDSSPGGPSRVQYRAGGVYAAHSWVNIAADGTGAITAHMLGAPSGQADFIIDITGYFK